jgi:hypothetical protein
MAERHSSQTGSREILIKGDPQRRQSDGKSVAKRLSAAPFTQATREVSKPATLALANRVRCLLLLKTSLPTTGRSYPLHAGTHMNPSIASGGSSCNALGGTRIRRVPRFQLILMSPGRQCVYERPCVGPPEAVGTAVGPEQEQRQQELLRHTPTARVERYTASAIGTSVVGEGHGVKPRSLAFDGRRQLQQIA